ncbi:LPS assembly lipoprotein LptE [Pontiella sulfatireligans]|uniref:Lipopolysaccharide-assembly n=1 Tax=Pontiella sulfatireligans TaxID=2750658 RepID=A0A6C2UJB4_9BACT|nr:LptE family protein [Pontiella sulfatireligans]VGO20049.1 hypothetical protein SCARR_02109 [Pontiella sulfatireligans]
MKRRIHLLTSLVATLFLTGCMGYQLGGSRPDGIETVYLAPVVNKTGETAIELPVTQALRERIQNDGRLKLVNDASQADAVIEVELVKFKLKAIAFQRKQKTTAREFRMRIDAVASLKSTTTDEILSESKTYGNANFTFDSDLTNAKRQATPRAAYELAEYMVDDLIEQW